MNSSLEFKNPSLRLDLDSVTVGAGAKAIVDGNPVGNIRVFNGFPFQVFGEEVGGYIETDAESFKLYTHINGLHEQSIDVNSMDKKERQLAMLYLIGKVIEEENAWS